MEMKRRDAYLLRTFGITLEQFDAIAAAQGQVCAVCKQPSDKTFHVDHDHKTGVVRGLLCWQCNHRVVGNHRDSARLRAAASYLDNPPAVGIIGEHVVPKKRARRKSGRVS